MWRGDVQYKYTGAIVSRLYAAAKPDGVVFPSCGGEMSSTNTLGRLCRVCTRRRSLTGWLRRAAVEKVSPPQEGNGPPLLVVWV